jgi:hypothetical protein
MTLKGIVKTSVVVLLVGAVVATYPPARLSALVLAGRSPECPLANAVRADQNLQDQINAKDRILKASKMIAKDEHFEQWQTPMGTYWITKESRYVLPYNLAEQDRKIYGEGPNFVKPGDIVLDCGANIGVFVKASLDAGAKKVVAIEPAPENLEALRRNFKSEIESGRVVIYPKGVWDKDDFLTMNIDHGNSATIDKLVAELGLERVDFIKMDIEGAEVRALKGGAGTIAKYHPRMSLSVYHEPDHPVEVPKAVRAAWSGYRMECGPCAFEKENKRIRPDIVYFHE